jgi:Domain of unknown function (DUF4326)
MKDWTESQRERQAAVLAGRSVVANVRKGADEALVAWAKAEGRFVYIGRQVRGWKQSDWANPFKEGVHGDRDAIIAAYRHHLDLSPGLKMRLPELRGKVLGCWCHPAPCHGDVLCEAAAEWRPSA